MKFPQLGIGERFEYEGEVYTKTSPVVAHRASGESRMIPRSASVRPLGRDAAPAAAPVGPLALFHAGVRALIAELPLDEARRDAALARVDALHDEAKGGR